MDEGIIGIIALLIIIIMVFSVSYIAQITSPSNASDTCTTENMELGYMTCCNITYTDHVKTGKNCSVVKE